MVDTDVVRDLRYAGVPIKVIAALEGVHFSTISKLCKRRSYGVSPDLLNLLKRTIKVGKITDCAQYLNEPEDMVFLHLYTLGLSEDINAKARVLAGLNKDIKVFCKAMGVDYHYAYKLSKKLNLGLNCNKDDLKRRLIIDAYNNGIDDEREIARLAGCTFSYAKIILTELGVHINYYDSMAEERSKIIEDYQAGMKPHDIAIKYCFSSRVCVTNILRDAGVLKFWDDFSKKKENRSSHYTKMLEDYYGKYAKNSISVAEKYGCSVKAVEDAVRRAL